MDDYKIYIGNAEHYISPPSIPGIRSSRLIFFGGYRPLREYIIVAKSKEIAKAMLLDFYKDSGEDYKINGMKEIQRDSDLSLDKELKIFKKAIPIILPKELEKLVEI